MQAICSRFADEPFACNVVKLDRRSRVSFLRYHDFTVPFPVLSQSLSLDISTGNGRQTDYRRRRNPPILHRKELLLPANHPLIQGATGLTRRLEARGAFVDARRIGTRCGWSRALAELGLTIQDGEVVGW